MKTKGNPNKNMSQGSDRFDRKSARVNSPQKNKSSKRKLSIYDEFDEDDINSLKFESDDNFDDLYDD